MPDPTPFDRALRLWGPETAHTQACMRGFEHWPDQREVGGVRVVACPRMGEMAVSPLYGHPVSIAQARREARDA